MNANPFLQQPPGTYAMTVQNPIGQERVQPVQYVVPEGVYSHLDTLYAALDECSTNATDASQQSACAAAAPLVDSANALLSQAEEDAAEGRTVQANAKATLAVSEMGAAIEALRGMFQPVTPSPEDLWAYMLQSNAMVLKGLDEERQVWKSYDPSAAGFINRIFGAPGRMLGLDPQWAGILGIGGAAVLGFAAWRGFGKKKRGRGKGRR